MGKMKKKAKNAFAHAHLSKRSTVYIYLSYSKTIDYIYITTITYV